MNPNMAQVLVSEHIKETRDQVAAARRGLRARGPHLKASTHGIRRGWLTRGE